MSHGFQDRFLVLGNRARQNSNRQMPESLRHHRSAGAQHDDLDPRSGAVQDLLGGSVQNGSRSNQQDLRPIPKLLMKAISIPDALVVVLSSDRKSVV